MTRSSRSTARRRAAALLAIGATALTGTSLLGPGTSSASSHREAPYVASDPAIDNTDVYAFTSPDKPNTATLIANWAPFSEPAGGPNFFPWATDAAYDINIDNNGDAKPDITYRWTFTDHDARGAGAGTFLYNNGPVTSFNDPNLLFKQTYKLEEIHYDAAGVATSTTLLPAGEAAPANIGSASMPDYAALRAEAVASGAIPGGGGQSYAGQADDPFFLDLRVFDLLYGANLKEAGFDTLKSFNVNTIALQVPKSDLAGAGDATANPVVGIWSTTSRDTVRTLKATNAAPGTDATHSTDEVTGTGGLTQVSRLGNPLVNEAVVPANLKDYFNRSTPDKDGQFLAKVQDPEVPQLIESIYKIPNPNATAGGKNRPDLVAAFLTGISKKAAAGTDFGGLAKGSPALDLNSLDLNANNASPAPAEYLRLNLGTPVTAAPNRLGVLGGDVQGFPNGRRLGDDVIDIALQALEGVLVPDQPAAVKSAVSGLGDGVNANDKKFLTSFPYIADPWSGSQPHVGQVAIGYRQSFKSGPGYVDASVTNLSQPQPGSFAELWQVVAGNREVKVGTLQLNSAGTASAGSLRVKAVTNTPLVLFFKVFVNSGSAAGYNNGLATIVKTH
jgi:hypothetical protein